MAVAIGGCAEQAAEGIEEVDVSSTMELEEEWYESEGQGLDAPGPKLATFEGKLIDLSKGRGEAHACLVLDADNVECFRTEGEAQARMEEIEASEPAPAAVDEATASVSLCSTSACFYEHRDYGGMICFRQRRTELNFSTWGFDNVMSSYKIGACNVTLWSGYSNTGAKKVLSAWSSSPYIGDSWNDVTSSIWIW